MQHCFRVSKGSKLKGSRERASIGHDQIESRQTSGESAPSIRAHLMPSDKLKTPIHSEHLPGRQAPWRWMRELEETRGGGVRLGLVIGIIKQT